MFRIAIAVALAALLAGCASGRDNYHYTATSFETVNAGVGVPGQYVSPNVPW